MNPLLLIAVFLVTGLLIPACFGWGVWRLTKKFPTWLRLQVTAITATFLTAIIFTPVGAEGPSFAPLGLMIIDMYSGVGGEDLRNHILQNTPVPFLCVWGGLYFVSMVVAGICFAIKRARTRHFS